MKKNGVYVTKSGLDKSRLELADLIKVKRLEITDRIQRAREYGDLTENSEYDAALEEQTLIENRIAELEEVLKNAEVIEEAIPNGLVVVGSTILLEMDGKNQEFTIVGRVEADPSKKRISNESPLGKAVLGAKIGEIVEVTTPMSTYKSKILQIK
jgi:transcription elongation factor GreA